MPQIVSLHDKYREHGFEVIGVSLDDDQAAFEAFKNGAGMTWRNYFDGQAWESALAQQYAVRSLPQTFLLDQEGTIIGKRLHGWELEEAIVAALNKE